MNEDLFPEEPKPEKKRHVSKQRRLLDYLRMGKPITEEIYNSEIGGRSVSAAIHNIKIRGGFEKGEYIVRDKMLSPEGSWVPSYRLVKESPVDIPQKEQELDEKRFSKEPEVGAFFEEPPLEMVDREINTWIGYVEEESEVPPVLNDTPMVSSIVVGVRRHEPELIVMFEGDFKPLRHVLTKMEVQYLLTNLDAFRPKKREE
jgi:hypothetical protein